MPMNNGSTRRKKRKGDDLDKASLCATRKRKGDDPDNSPLAATKKRSSARSCKSTRQSATKGVSKNIQKPQPGSADQYFNSASLTDKDKDTMRLLLQKAHVDKNLISAIQSQIQNPSQTTVLSVAERTESDKVIPRRSSTKQPIRPAAERANQTGRRSSRNSTGNDPLDDNEQENDEDDNNDDEDVVFEDDDDDVRAEFQNDNSGAFHPDYMSGGEDRQMSRLANANEKDHNVPNLGESDGEQEVSFNADHADNLGNLDNVDNPDPQPPAAEHGEQEVSFNADHADNLGNLDNVDNPDPQPPAAEHERIIPVLPRTDHGAITQQLRAHGALDESILLNFLEVLKSSISANMDTSFKQLLTEIKSDRKEIKMLREHVTELTSIVTTSASAMFIKNTSAKPRMQEIHNKLCLLPALFGDNLMLRILPRVVVGFISSKVLDGCSHATLQLKGMELFSVLYFSVQPNENKREKLSSNVGLVYSKFRYGLLMSSFFAMQQNVFRTFRTDPFELGVGGPLTTGEEETSTVVPSASSMIQPFWLKPGYVLPEHCKLAANKQERSNTNDAVDDNRALGELSQANCDSESTDMQDSSNSGGKQKVNRTGPLTRDEIGTEAANLLHRCITSTLKRSRIAGKSQLFHDVMYLFVSWGQHAVSVCQNTMSVKWEKPLDPSTDYNNDVPRTKATRPQDQRSVVGDEMDRNDFDNLTHLETLISQHPELCLLVEHDVKVNGRTERTSFRVSLIEVACRALSAYVTFESAAKVRHALSADKRSLKGVMVLALALRKLLEKGVTDLNNSNDVPWINNVVPKRTRGRPKRTCTTNTPDLNASSHYMFETVNGMSIAELLPAPSKQKDALNQMILNLTQEEFNTKSQNPSGTGIVDESEAIGGVGSEASQEAGIQADETQGVFGF